jgi:hypothetical protein
MLRKIKRDVRNTLAIILNFWADIGTHRRGLDYGGLVDLDRLVHHMDSTFRDPAEKYTNSQDLCNEDCNFLINGAAKFRDTCTWRLKADMIECGIHLDKDFVFRSLANCCPRYLLDGIFNNQGRDLRRPGADIASHMSNSEAVAGERGGAENDRDAIAPTLIRGD